MGAGAMWLRGVAGGPGQAGWLHSACWALGGLLRAGRSVCRPQQPQGTSPSSAGGRALRCNDWAARRRPAAALRGARVRSPGPALRLTPRALATSASTAYSSLAPRCAASASGVFRPASAATGSAPAPSRACAAARYWGPASSRQPATRAWRGVESSTSPASASAPAASSAATASAAPAPAAQCSGVRPVGEMNAGSAPMASRASTAAALPAPAATLSGLSPRASSQFTFPPARASARTASAPASPGTPAAQCSGVRPSVLGALGAAPAFSSARTTSTLPTARCRAVAPLLGSGWFRTPAPPACSSQRTAERFPSVAAWRRSPASPAPTAEPEGRKGRVSGRALRVFGPCVASRASPAALRSRWARPSTAQHRPPQSRSSLYSVHDGSCI